MVHTDHGTVGRYHVYLDSVDLLELTRLRRCGSGHTAELGIESNQVFESDGAQDLSLLLLRHALFGFNRGVESCGPAAVLYDSTFKLVHRLNGALLDQVVNVAAQKRMSVQGILDRT